jgi:hypothetical protein
MQRLQQQQQKNTNAIIHRRGVAHMLVDMLDQVHNQWHQIMGSGCNQSCGYYTHLTSSSIGYVELLMMPPDVTKRVLGWESVIVVVTTVSSVYHHHLHRHDCWEEMMMTRSTTTISTLP